MKSCGLSSLNVMSLSEMSQVCSSNPSQAVNMAVNLLVTSSCVTRSTSTSKVNMMVTINKIIKNKSN